MSMICLQSLVGKIFKSKSGTVVTGCLKGVSNPECHVIESVEDSNLGSDGGLFVVHGSKRLRIY
jgi:hypothetical protein